MDRISGLADELLVKILLFLPTKIAVSTSILSKRWEFLWMWLPKLLYGDRFCSASEGKRLHCFLDRNLPLHRAPLIESLSLHFSDAHLEPKDFKLWIMTAVSRIIHELDISYGCFRGEWNILPSNLFICKSLVTLKVDGHIPLDVPRMVCFPCLKTLHLKYVAYSNEDCLQRLLSSCPVLDDLLVHRSGTDKIKKFTVRVPSLKSLSLFIPYVVEDQNIFPSNLYTCKLLVALKLDGNIFLHVPPTVCLPSLKTLHLRHVTYLNDGCLQRLLSNCHALEDLSVHYRYEGENMKKFTVIVPSLRRLSLYIPLDVDEFVINTPSLKYFDLALHNSKSHYFSIAIMPELKEAHLDVQFLDLKSLIRSIASVKRLDFCLTADSSEAVYGDGFVFNKLEYLKLCSFARYSSNVLVWLLKDSPNLRFLDLYQMDGHENEGLVSWTQPSSVPECMLSSLQTFEWSGYLGRPQDKELVTYVLENTRRLMYAKISTDDDCLVPKLEMVKELALCSRASTACKLIFNTI